MPRLMVVFEHDLNKSYAIDWFPLGLKGSKTKMTYNDVERWLGVHRLTYIQQIDNTTPHIRANCCVSQ